jgi:hypothetical protein
VRRFPCAGFVSNGRGFESDRLILSTPFTQRLIQLATVILLTDTWPTYSWKVAWPATPVAKATLATIAAVFISTLEYNVNREVINLNSIENNHTPYILTPNPTIYTPRSTPSLLPLPFPVQRLTTLYQYPPQKQ